MVKRKIPEKEWKWSGFAGHFILASRCRFHLCTDVGDFRISSIGALYINEGDEKPSPVGATGLYETMVFSLGAEICGCGCRERKVSDWCEIRGIRAETAADAVSNHMRLCQEFASL